MAPIVMRAELAANGRRTETRQLVMFEELNSLELWDFSIYSFATSEAGDDVLQVRGAVSSYSTAATIQFYEVQFISAPTLFHHALFRLATTDEIAATRKLVDFDCELFAIESDGAYTFLIAAASVRVSISES